MSSPNDDHALRQSPESRGLKSAARRCLFALLKLIRRIPRVLHALLVLALSTMCVTIIFVWVALWCCPTLRSGYDKFLFCGIIGEIGKTRVAHYVDIWALSTTLVKRVTLEIQSSIAVGKSPSRRRNIASLYLSIPVDETNQLAPFSWERYCFGIRLAHGDSFEHRDDSSIIIDTSEIPTQMKRTGLALSDVLRIADQPRLVLSIILPLWFCVLMTGWYPLFLVVRGPLRRRRRARRGWCIKCGYDLTGNESGVCPECGKSVTSKLRRRR